MSTRGPCKQPNEQSEESPGDEMVLNLDLNSPPVEGLFPEGTSASIESRLTLGTAVPIDPQVTSSQFNKGVLGSPIDVEAIDDDVELLFSTDFSQGRHQSRRKRRLTVDLDVSLETAPTQPGVTISEPMTTILSLNIHSNREGILTTRNFINCEQYFDEEDKETKRQNVMNSSHHEPQMEAAPLPLPPPPTEPTFSCPVCMSSLTEPCSTICGHIFCQCCIEAAIKARKQCPTCRAKLASKKSFHRVYLPTTD